MDRRTGPGHGASRSRPDLRRARAAFVGGKERWLRSTKFCVLWWGQGHFSCAVIGSSIERTRSGLQAVVPRSALFTDSDDKDNVDAKCCL